MSNDSIHLAPEQLHTRCDPAQFDFADTRALPEAEQPFGQQRACATMCTTPCCASCC